VGGWDFDDIADSDGGFKRASGCGLDVVCDGGVGWLTGCDLDAVTDNVTADGLIVMNGGGTSDGYLGGVGFISVFYD
jgi:hypothetical protein